MKCLPRKCKDPSGTFQSVFPIGLSNRPFSVKSLVVQSFPFPIRGKPCPTNAFLSPLHIKKFRRAWFYTNRNFFWRPKCYLSWTDRNFSFSFRMHIKVFLWKPITLYSELLFCLSIFWDIEKRSQYFAKKSQKIVVYSFRNYR